MRQQSYKPDRKTVIATVIILGVVVMASLLFVVFVFMAKPASGPVDNPYGIVERRVNQAFSVDEQDPERLNRGDGMQPR